MTVDPFNRGEHHAAVLVGSVVLAVLLWAAGYSFSRVVAAVPWFLLFLVLIIGPVTKIWPPINRRFKGNFPLYVRSELGIWFVMWSLAHVLLVFQFFGWDVVGFVVGMSTWAFAAIVGFLIAVILLFTSNIWAYRFMGPKAWKWHQSHGTYVMFWLLTVHIYDQTFLRGAVPIADSLHLLYVISILIVVGLHLGAFIKVVAHYRRHGKYPSGIQ
jgi:sulfoxide reductase heme-binding subunit YedZ